MDSRLTVSSNCPVFTAITTIKNPSKLLSDADVKYIANKGKKLGNNTKDTLDIFVDKSQKYPDDAFVFSYVAAKTKNGSPIPNLDTNMQVIPYAKISPIDMVKRTLSRLEKFYNA